MTDRFEDFETANALDDDNGGEQQEQEQETQSAEDKNEAGEEDRGNEKSESDALREWQSKADKAEARANKAEQALARLQRQQSSGGERKATAPASSSSSDDAWVAASKDNFRDDLFRSDPRLEALGFDPSLIQGATPAEMRQSFVSLQGTVDRMETGIRNRVLVEHGLEPVPGSGDRATGVNYRTMPDDEFRKVMDRALQG
jgi:hypothetical protein